MNLVPTLSEYFINHITLLYCLSSLVHAGSGSVQFPSSKQVLRFVPFRTNPGSQAYTALEPTEVPVVRTLPFSGGETGPQSRAA